MNNKILKEVLDKYNIKELEITRIESFGELSTKRAIEVYNDNYNIQNMLGEIVFYGYEELLKNLRLCSLEEICLHDIELSNGKIIIVFTNIEQDDLIGSIAQFKVYAS